MSSVPSSLDDLWPALKSLVEQGLLDAIPQDTTCPPRLREAMTYSLSAGGKRLRPVLTLLACRACGGEQEAALPAACAIEMVHTYSLIHDDLPAMDDDDLRRGRPTNHKVYGEALAILAGDALLTLAFQTLVEGIRPPEIAARCCADLADAAGPCGMVGGQVADLEAETHPVRDVDELEAIHRRKTGRLLSCALTMGARIGNATPEQFAALEIYGKAVGLAFQIADDVLDVTGSEERMGKGVAKDASRGKQTYPGFLGLDASRDKASTLIDEARRALTVFGASSAPLKELAMFVIQRDH